MQGWHQEFVRQKVKMIDAQAMEVNCEETTRLRETIS